MSVYLFLCLTLMTVSGCLTVLSVSLNVNDGVVDEEGQGGTHRPGPDPVHALSPF